MNWQIFIKRRPVTNGFIILNAISFIISFFLFNFSWFHFLTFNSHRASSEIWTLFTYPFAQNEFVSVLFSSLWTFTIGSFLEEHLSSRHFFVLLGISIFMTPCIFHLVNLIYPVHISLSGTWIPLAFITVFWGARYPNQMVNFNLIFPMKAIWLAYITMALIFFSFKDPINAFIMLLCSSFFFYEGKNFKFNSLTKKRENQKFIGYIDEVYLRKKKREEDEKLRKLFEKSFDENNHS